MTQLSNFRTPAVAEYYFEIKNEKDILQLFDVIQFAKEKNLPVLIIGGGTNMLFAFNVFKGVVIKNCLEGWTYNEDSKILKTFSNNSIRNIAYSLEEDYGQNMWHRLIGLPGSIGGAVFGNAGCFGLETENNFLSAKVLELSTGEIKVLEKKEMDFEYRSSIFKNRNENIFSFLVNLTCLLR